MDSTGNNINKNNNTIKDSTFPSTIPAFKPGNMPSTPGVYIMKNLLGEIIYIGKAKDLKKRVSSYFVSRKHTDFKTACLISNVHMVDYMITSTELEALILEDTLIKKYKPKYNILLKDDKHYPFIKLSVKEKFPSISMVRKVSNDGAEYYGPYVPTRHARKTLRFLHEVFDIRHCKGAFKRNTRPCLNHQMGRCSAPCAGLIDEKSYGELVKEVRMFLRGRGNSLLKKLTRDIKTASENLEFEKAIRLREKIKAITKVLEKQAIFFTDKKNRDIIITKQRMGETYVILFLVRDGYLRGRESYRIQGSKDEKHKDILSAFIKQHYMARRDFIPDEILVEQIPSDIKILKKWLKLQKGANVQIILPKTQQMKKLFNIALLNVEHRHPDFSNHLYNQGNDLNSNYDFTQEYSLAQLAEYLKLPNKPYIIDGFDISCIHGKYAVGAAVRFVNGKPSNKQYKRFRIKLNGHADDYGMMAEMLLRYAKHIISGDIKPPDLILIDGGKGHLNTALSVFKKAGLSHIPVISIAKKEEEIYTKDNDKPTLLPPDCKALLILKHIRDESHRFAITYHRKIRGRRYSSSILSKIPGLGEKRSNALLKYFGSIEAIKAASPEDLKKVPGIGPKYAKLIYTHFQNETAVNIQV